MTVWAAILWAVAIDVAAIVALWQIGAWIW